MPSSVLPTSHQQGLALTSQFNQTNWHGRSRRQRQTQKLTGREWQFKVNGCGGKVESERRPWLQMLLLLAALLDQLSRSHLQVPRFDFLLCKSLYLLRFLVPTGFGGATTGPTTAPKEGKPVGRKFIK